MTLPVLSVDLVKAAQRSSGFLSMLSPEVLKEMETRYRKFLRLVQKHPNYPLSPTFDIDEMWHLHMLHPRAYYHDCMNLFGGILDHDGGFGKTEEERPILLQCASETEKFWKEEYGEEYVTPLAIRLKKKFAPRTGSMESKEQQYVCVVSPEAKEGQYTPEWCVVSPESKEQQYVCVVSPELREAMRVCVVSPESKEQQYVCVVSPELKEAMRVCVVSPESKEQQYVCDVSPELKEAMRVCVVKTGEKKG